MTFQHSNRTPSGRRGGDRRGSVLVVVLALLSALMLLGFLFFTIASQERENARYFTASEKWYSAQLSADELFDFALEQVIVGPQDDLANSALWGGRYSLLANLVGDDLQPYSGRGVNIDDAGRMTGGPGDGQAYVDANGNGLQDDGTVGSGTGAQRQLRLDVAGYTIGLGAPGGTFHNLRDAVSAGSIGFYTPDVPYTYPDINSPFLAYIGTEPFTQSRVIIPSFHRPQYLRGLFGAANSANWYIDPASLPYVLRPHAERPARIYNYQTGQIETAVTGGNPVMRFESGATGPYFNPSPAPSSPLGTPTDPGEGFWDRTAAAPPAGPLFGSSYDADADNDGIAEAIWLDLDHPVEETPDGTQKFIPLFAITVYDLDGLLNVNAHGNHYGTPASLASLSSPPASPFSFLSRSNEGRRRNEVNPQWAWLDNPGPTAMPPGADYSQHQRFFGAVPTTPTQLANMEWWFILAGRGERDNSGKTTQLFTGRYGEVNRLTAGLNANSLNPYDYSRAGLTASDEPAGVADGNRGSAFTDVNGQLFPPTMIFPAPRQPADYQGQGTYVGNDGKTPLVMTALASLPAEQQAALAMLGRVRVPLYQNYWLPPQATSGIGPTWAYALSANFPTLVRLVTAMAANTGLISGDGRLVDDPGETMLDAEQARDQVTDSIFGPDETAALHMTDNDRTNNGIVSRLLKLAPANFGQSTTNALDRRRRLTTVSSDLKAYSASVPVDPARALWEVDAIDPAYPNVPTFPPRFLAAGTGGAFDPLEPFRPEARGLLAAMPNMTTSPPNARVGLKQLSRKLSANHVASAYVGRDGQPRFLLRPLTPHPVRQNGVPVLGSGAVIAPPGVPNGTSGVAPRFGISDQQLNTLEANDNDFIDGYLPSSIQTIDHDSDSATAPVPNPTLQEWHARRDRQNLARDIYMLLYTFGNAASGDVTATNPYSTGQLVEMAQFAVNVVDAMDADDAITCFVFDTDPTPTGLGYTPYDDGYVNPVPGPPIDANPAVDEDGDGDPANDFLHYIDGTTGRGMVFGVEEQKLAFGEALAMLADRYEPVSGSPEDHGATDWDDEEYRDFAFVELQNMTATPVPLTGGWSVVAKVSSTFEAARAVTIKTPTTTPVSIPPGTSFTIGTAGDAHNSVRTAPSDARTTWDGTSQPNVRPSHFSVDLAGTASGDPGNFTDYEQIAPVTPPSAVGTTALNFDLMFRENSAGANGQHSFRMNEVDAADVRVDQDAFGSVDDNETPPPSGTGGTSPKAGGWLHLGPLATRGDLVGSGVNVTFYLRRRANLDRTTPAETYPAIDYTSAPATPPAAIESDNPWVVVDSIQVTLQDYNPDTSPVSAAVQAVVSDERSEPLYRVDAAAPDYAATPTTPDFNNLGVTTPGGPMQLWQRHFDRPFASLADLLTVPLYGPSTLTQRLSSGGTAVNPTETAAVNFLFPDDDPRATPTTETDLWYRLFEFVEIPQKHGDNDGLPWFADYGGPSQWLSDPGQRQDWLRERLRLREFGKLNLNTIRHPHALAGLLDDPRVFTFQNGNLPATFVNGDQWLGASRDWWLSMLASRDGGFDPYTQANIPGAQPAILPGVPSARPFLEFGSAPMAGTAAAIAADFQRTLLRPIPAVAMPFSPRGFEAGAGRRSLFELGNMGGGGGPILGSNAEFSTRYRLLGKVLNHGTTRSNTYVAFIQCDFFEAAPVGTDGDHDGDGGAATPPVYQIRGKMPVDPSNPNQPRYRGVFVIDRTLALELLRRRDLPPSAALPNPPGLYPENSKYRTFSFARERGPDQRPQPTFDWQDLIQYRRVVAQ